MTECNKAMELRVLRGGRVAMIARVELGRFLAGRGYPVTAREMTDAEGRRYGGWKRR